MSEFKTKSIKFSSRLSCNVGNSYYTIESTIEKQCPETFTEQEYLDAKQQLWDECNNEVDTQLEKTLEFIQQQKQNSNKRY